MKIKGHIGHVVRQRVERFGIPVDSCNPRRYWIISLNNKSKQPTVEELRCLHSYRDYMIHEKYTTFDEQRLLIMLLPECTGHNTTIFRKLGPNAWVYRNLLWSQDVTYYVPCSKENRRPEGIPLVALFDHVEGVGTKSVGGGTPQCINWKAWKTCHPTVFS